MVDDRLTIRLALPASLFWAHAAPPPYLQERHPCEARQEHEPPMARSHNARQGGNSRVEASDREEAKAVAAVQFEPDEIQRNRIMVQELA